MNIQNIQNYTNPLFAYFYYIKCHFSSQFYTKTTAYCVYFANIDQELKLMHIFNKTGLNLCNYFANIDLYKDIYIYKRKIEIKTTGIR